MADYRSQGVTSDDILVGAKRFIAEFGWARMSWPEYGPAPRCIRSALAVAATDMRVLAGKAHHQAIRRVSEAIYGRGAIGGINDWEFRKSTDKAAVIAMLQKAIEMGPLPAEHKNARLWPV